MFQLLQDSLYWPNPVKGLKSVSLSLSLHRSPVLPNLSVLPLLSRASSICQVIEGNAALKPNGLPACESGQVCPGAEEFWQSVRTHKPVLFPTCFLFCRPAQQRNPCAALWRLSGPRHDRPREPRERPLSDWCGRVNGRELHNGTSCFGA